MVIDYKDKLHTAWPTAQDRANARKLALQASDNDPDAAADNILRGVLTDHEYGMMDAEQGDEATEFIKERYQLDNDGEV